MSGFRPSPGRWPIRVREHWLERDGEPWIPIVGEMHFSRVPRHRWRPGLAALAAAGLDVVSTYVLWNHHEEHRGRFVWDGRRDLLAFLEHAAAAQLSVLLRIGPWVHAESRNGGFPDWVAALDRTRCDAPEYLAAVRPYVAQIAEQAAWACEAGIVVGIQVENELYDQPEHLSTLRSIAEEEGLLVPLWTATGWGRAAFDRDRLLPVFGGYPDSFWTPASDGWDAHCAVHYRFSPVRDDTTIGGDVRSVPLAEAESAPDAATPYASCELGGGMAVAYHRRPVIAAADVSALALTKLGSGSVWHGYYMFHGGIQFHGESSSMHESQARGYPNDLPLRDYDFQAPVGAAGGVRESYHRLRVLHLTMRTVQSMLATSHVTFPDSAPDALRYAVRATAEAAFVFVNNHEPHSTLPEHRGVAIPVHMGDDTVLVPPVPMTVRDGDHFVLPVLMPLAEGVVVRSASAQPLTSIEADGETVWFFQSIDDEAWFEFEPGCVSNAATGERDGRMRVRTGPTGSCVVRAGDVRVRIEVVDAEGARALWRSPVQDLVVESEEPLVFEPDLVRVSASASPVTLVVTGHMDPGAARRAGWHGEALPDGRWRWSARPPMDAPRRLHVSLVRAASDGYRPLEPQPGAPRAPVAADFAGAAVFEFDADECIAAGTLRIRWHGDVLRLGVVDPGRQEPLTDAEVIVDQFFHGAVLDVDTGLLGAGLLETGLPGGTQGRVVRVEILARAHDDDRYPWLGERHASLEEALFIPTTLLELPTARPQHGGPRS